MSSHVVGIDLGTTHCALAHASDGGKIIVDEVPQLVALGEIANRTLLPSALYLPGLELPSDSLRMPWSAPDAPPQIVGELARAQGAIVPGRLITSAKSWLGHARVDRLAPILPWGGDEGVAKRSPVGVSSTFLAHLCGAFAAATGADARTQDVILCVPASFDEVARQLTLRAATDVGLRPTLLEEPQAAFYAWLADHLRDWKTHLGVGDEILVCDLGGGTTDFTLIRVTGEDRDRPVLERYAIGDHLLLGGDNMDLTLARRVESRLRPDGRLEHAQFAALTQACRVAKERLLDDARATAARQSWTVTIAGRGSRLIGGAMHDELSRGDAEALILDGFFPRVGADTAPTRARSALTELNLPYAADPAVTRHLAAFLRNHGARPTAILWNGGVTKSPAIRARLLEVIGGWLGAPIRELPGAAPDLAVARGAAYYGLARRGQGVRIGGGSPRAYYVGVDTAAVKPGEMTVLCVAPRGMLEGTRDTVDQHPLEALTNRPVRFRLYSSTELTGDLAGDLLTVPIDSLAEQEPLYTVLRFVRSSLDVALNVALEVQLSELGALEIDCVALGTGHETDRWRLAFDLRARESAPEAASSASPVASEDPQALAMALEILRSVYGKDPDTRFADLQPAAVMKSLAGPLGPKDSWSPSTLRALWEPLKDLRGGRGKSPAHEARWMNLVGYCLRPGFGYPLDDWRVKETWRAFNAGLVHDKDAPCRLEWWVMWRRISGGLIKTQQDEIMKRLAPYLLPAAKKIDRKSVSRQELAEMWRTIASMERVPHKQKSELGDALITELEKKEAPEHALWALGRLGARVPLYGPAEGVVPIKRAERWLERLLAMTWKGEPEALAAAELARMSGDRARDLDEGLRKRLADRLRTVGGGSNASAGRGDGAPLFDGERLARLVLEPIAREAREERLAFGDALPQGLRLSAPDLTPEP